MTTNQTIDGVPRGLLERIFSHLFVKPALKESDCKELRTLLDKSDADIQASPMVVLPERLTEAELEELEVIEALIHGQGLHNLAGAMAAARQFIDEVTRLNTK